MRALIALSLVCALALGCSRGAPPESAASATAAPTTAAEETIRLNEWLDARYEEELDFSPLTKTQLGRKDDYDRIDDFSESGAQAQLQWRRATVLELERQFDRAALTAEGQTSYDLWRYGLERSEAAWPFRRRGYVFHQMSGPHTFLPQALISFHRVDDEADMVAYVTRIGEAARALGQALERARVAAGEGVHAPRFAYDAVIEQARALITGTPFEGAGQSPLYADAQAKIAALVTAGRIDGARADELRVAVATALTDRLGPAYEALIVWAEADRAASPEIVTGTRRPP
jgi:uncharacterized protein (DUF885 family)